MSRRPVLAPSILAADFGRLAAHAGEAVAAGAEWLHIDVMDGQFVPNISFGPPAVKALRPLADETGVLLDVHLMIDRPERFLADFAAAGADRITVHVEATAHVHRAIQAIQELGVRAGVTLNPGTPLTHVLPLLPLVDLVLVMSVNPGFGGQAYIPGSTERIRLLRAELDRLASPAWLEVDGGINVENVGTVVAAGATAIVAGSAVFGGRESTAENVRALLTLMRT